MKMVLMLALQELVWPAMYRTRPLVTRGVSLVTQLSKKVALQLVMGTIKVVSKPAEDHHISKQLPMQHSSLVTGLNVAAATSSEMSAQIAYMDLGAKAGSCA